MNVFEKVTQARPEIEGAEENMSTARQRLLTEIHGAPQTVKVRAARRPWIIAGSLVGAAAAVTAGVLVVNAFAPPTGNVEAIPTAKPRPSVEPSQAPQPTAEPLTASSAFGAASSAAASFTGLTVAPGQYLRIETVTHDLVLYEPINKTNSYLVNRANATSAWDIISTGERYVPADLHGEWRYFGTSTSLGALYGPDAQQHVQEMGPLFSPGGPLGETGGPVAPWGPEGETQHLADFLELMPNDPAQLIAWADAHLTTPSETPGTKVGWFLIDLLAENVGSAQTREAMYTALSMLDGFELVSVDGDIVTVAVVTSVEDESGATMTMRRTAAIDVSTGLVKERTVTRGSGSPIVPDGVPDFRESYSVSVVDTAP